LDWAKEGCTAGYEDQKGVKLMKTGGWRQNEILALYRGKTSYFSPYGGQNVKRTKKLICLPYYQKGGKAKERSKRKVGRGYKARKEGDY